MWHDKSSNFRDALPRNLTSFDDRLEQPDELGLPEVRVVKDRFDDRRLLRSCKQNLGFAMDRSLAAAGLPEKPDCADDDWQPYTKS